jgi:peptidoglycan/LPS O-acetylase OafA/YrhL
LPPLVQWINGLGVRQDGLLLPLVLIGSTVLTAALATLSYRWVEVPSMNLGSLLTRRIQSGAENGRRAGKNRGLRITRIKLRMAARSRIKLLNPL